MNSEKLTFQQLNSGQYIVYAWGDACLGFLINDFNWVFEPETNAGLSLEDLKSIVKFMEELK